MAADLLVNLLELLIVLSFLVADFVHWRSRGGRLIYAPESFRGLAVYFMCLGSGSNLMVLWGLSLFWPTMFGTFWQHLPPHLLGLIYLIWASLYSLRRRHREVGAINFTAQTAT
ncbi:MAG TPA: hypothetical protein VH253_03565 [Phycisphaerae bacterium]|nr:hypothetical protein [Phycisphaerae bacterium]